jgi:hypothetical protein
MPLQNRVTPFGEIIATPDRGLFLGNRGIIHDPATKTLLSRRWSLKAWIVCVCAFRGRRREPMAQRSWTELFFLDEATAFAAGHRPCFYCRRPDAEAFRFAFSAGLKSLEPLKAPEIDSLLHGERLSARAKRLHPIQGSSRDLPDGAMVAESGEAYLVRNGEALPWSSAGYGSPIALTGEIWLLTPPSTVQAFRAGYKPVLHPSACPEPGQ